MKCIKITYEARIVAARWHLLSQKNTNRYLVYVISHKESKLLRVGRELLAKKAMKTGNQAFLVEHMSEKC